MGYTSSKPDESAGGQGFIQYYEGGMVASTSYFSHKVGSGANWLLLANFQPIGSKMISNVVMIILLLISSDCFHSSADMFCWRLQSWLQWRVQPWLQLWKHGHDLGFIADMFC